MQFAHELAWKMPFASDLTSEQFNALLELGMTEDQIPDFLAGRPVVYGLPTESEPGVAIIQWTGSRLRSGIVTVSDPGGGVKTLLCFRSRSNRVAEVFGLDELELLGAAVINDDLRRLLVRHGYQAATEQCPDELGGGTMETLAKVYPVRKTP